MATKNLFLVFSVCSPLFWNHHFYFPLRGHHSHLPVHQVWVEWTSALSTRRRHVAWPVRDTGDWSDMWSRVANENQPQNQGSGYEEPGELSPLGMLGSWDLGG